MGAYVNVMLLVFACFRYVEALLLLATGAIVVAHSFLGFAMYVWDSDPNGSCDPVIMYGFFSRNNDNFCHEPKAARVAIACCFFWVASAICLFRFVEITRSEEFVHKKRSKKRSSEESHSGSHGDNWNENSVINDIEEKRRRPQSVAWNENSVTEVMEVMDDP
jgi:hypothetical protein